MVSGASVWQSRSCQGIDTIRASRGERVVSGGVGTEGSTAAAFTSSVRCLSVVLVGDSGLSLGRCGLGIGALRCGLQVYVGKFRTVRRYGCRQRQVMGAQMVGWGLWEVDFSVLEKTKLESSQRHKWRVGLHHTTHSAARKTVTGAGPCASTVPGLCMPTEGPSCTPT